MLEPVSCLARHCWDGSRALGAGEGTGSKESASCRGLVSQSLKAQDLQLLRVHFLLTTLALFRWESTAVLDKCVFLGPTLIPNRKPWYVRRNFRAYISPSLGKILLPCRRHSTAWSRCYWERWKHARSQCRGKGNDWGQHGYHTMPWKTLSPYTLNTHKVCGNLGYLVERNCGSAVRYSGARMRKINWCLVAQGETA